MRSMDEILSSTPAKSEATGGAVAAKVEEQADAKVKDVVVGGEKPAATKPETVTPASAKDTSDKKDPLDAHEDAEDEHVPDNLDGLKRALAAARGDKRRARKLYREIETKVHDAEKQIAEYKGRLVTYDQQRQQVVQHAPAAPTPSAPVAPGISLDDFYAKGPEAVTAYVEPYVAKQISQAKEEIRRSMSVSSARARHPDYETKVAATVGYVPPHIEQQILASDDPAEAWYQFATAFEQFRDINSVDDLRSKMKAEARAELEAEFSARGQAPAAQHPVAPKPPIPQSLAGARGNGAGQPARWIGPRSMNDILR